MSSETGTGSANQPANAVTRAAHVNFASVEIQHQRGEVHLLVGQQVPGIAPVQVVNRLVMSVPTFKTVLAMLNHVAQATPSGEAITVTTLQDTPEA